MVADSARSRAQGGWVRRQRDTTGSAESRWGGVGGRSAKGRALDARGRRGGRRGPPDVERASVRERHPGRRTRHRTPPRHNPMVRRVHRLCMRRAPQRHDERASKSVGPRAGLVGGSDRGWGEGGGGGECESCRRPRVCGRKVPTRDRRSGASEVSKPENPDVFRSGRCLQNGLGPGEATRSVFGPRPRPRRTAPSARSRLRFAPCQRGVPRFGPAGVRSPNALETSPHAFRRFTIGAEPDACSPRSPTTTRRPTRARALGAGERPGRPAALEKGNRAAGDGARWSCLTPFVRVARWSVTRAPGQVRPLRCGRPGVHARDGLRSRFAGASRPPAGGKTATRLWRLVPWSSSLASMQPCPAPLPQRTCPSLLSFSFARARCQVAAR